MIVCRKCDQKKETSEFYPYMVRICGHAGLCKRCHASAMAENRANNPDRVKGYKKSTWQKTKDRRAAMLAAREVQL